MSNYTISAVTSCTTHGSVMKCPMGANEMYGVQFKSVSDNYYSKLSPSDREGGGGSRSFLIEITKDGNSFISTETYVEKLSPYNNRLQDARIKSQCGNRMVVEHDVVLNERDHVYGKARILLDALRSTAKEPVNA